MADNFRKKVITIVAGLCEDCPNKVPEEHPEYEGETRNECYGQCIVDRIMAEVEKLAAGMPHTAEGICNDSVTPFLRGVKECQAFIRKELQ